MSSQSLEHLLAFRRIYLENTFGNLLQKRHRSNAPLCSAAPLCDGCTALSFQGHERRGRWRRAAGPGGSEREGVSPGWRGWGTGMSEQVTRLGRRIFRLEKKQLGLKF